MVDLNKIEEWQHWIEHFVIGDVKRSLEKDDIGVGLIILCLVGIDCLGGYRAGKESDVSTFKVFLTEYFPEKYNDFAIQIWGLRSDLMHDYTFKKSKFEMTHYERESEKHLTWSKSRQSICFNRYKFASDFLNAWDKFLTDVTGNDDLYQKVVRRWKKHGMLTIRSGECD